MKFSTSSILSLVALAAATSFPFQVSASFGGTILQKNKSLKSKSVPSASLEESLTLYGLDRSVPLTKDEVIFLEEVIQDAYNKVYEETGEEDLITNSVLIEDVAVEEEGNRSLLRGSSSSHRRQVTTSYISDQEMCSYPDGSIIPGCEFDICFYRDNYCNWCEKGDDYWDTSAPTRAPTLEPTRDPCNDPLNYGGRCDDDDGTFDWKKYVADNKSEPPSMSPTSSPTSSPTEYIDYSGRHHLPNYVPPTPAPIYNPYDPNNCGDRCDDDDGDWKSHVPPPTSPPTSSPTSSPVVKDPLTPSFNPMDDIILKMLKASPFSRLRAIKKVRVSSSKNPFSRRGRGGN